MYTYPAQVAAPVPLQLDQQSVLTEDENDYRVWRFSKFAFTALVFLLFLFSLILCLSIWQSNSDIKDLQARLPRDVQFQVDSSEQEAGIKRYKRDIRFVVCCFAIILPSLAALVYLVPLGVFRSMLNYIIAFFLVLLFILSLVQFGLDVNGERDARECTLIQYTATTTRQHCESREAVATLLPIFDALVAVFSITAAYQLVWFSKSGDWSRANESKDAFTPEPLVPGLRANGVTSVRTTITVLVLFFLFASGIILLVSTLIVHESRVELDIRDTNNRVLNNQQPGWPRKNTALRYALCGFAILTILCNFIPLESRVVAYTLAFFYCVFAILAFTAFALDVDTLQDARDEVKNPCNFTSPFGTVECSYHPYVSTVVLEFFAGVFLLAYVVIEYIILRLCFGHNVSVHVNRTVRRPDGLTYTSATQVL
eukprot:NODE_1150_length_1447_cov_654.979545_g1139_i0.p1 GENE.NODE_1150_length_1447_cov_654.979545_g1139_i0~~NODE_1150_length_1447_cov_654.979545_g1139_i0.p1  ORF type:complete len:426 (+),score=84.43 NODE_1150_length_1447_cov_654.979545_g1139_i0:66-1343(+)